MTITIGRPLLAAIATIVFFSSGTVANASQRKSDPQHHAAIVSKDSLHIDLKGLNGVLHQLDTALQSLKGKHFAVHLDSGSVGPFHTPEMKIGPFDIPEWNIHVPEMKLPPMDIPKIEIPKIDEDVSIGEDKTI